MVKRKPVRTVAQEEAPVRRLGIDEEYPATCQGGRRSEYRPVPGRHGFVSDSMAQRVRRPPRSGKRHGREPPPLQFVFIVEVQHRSDVYVDRDQVARLRPAHVG